MAATVRRITVFAAGMQNDEIVDELHVSLAKHHLDRHAWAMTERVEIIENLNFLRTQAYALMDDPIDGIAIVTAMQQIVVETENRDAFGGYRRFPWIVLSASMVIEATHQDFRILRMFIENGVVQFGGAEKQAGATLDRLAKAQQAH
jgi:hypothetical protein